MGELPCSNWNERTAEGAKEGLQTAYKVDFDCLSYHSTTPNGNICKLQAVNVSNLIKQGKQFPLKIERTERTAREWSDCKMYYLRLLRMLNASHNTLLWTSLPQNIWYKFRLRLNHSARELPMDLPLRSRDPDAHQQVQHTHLQILF